METYTLNWDDNFLYLCTHCARDGFNSLLHYCDLMRLARYKLTDDSWNRMENKIKSWGLESVTEACVQILKGVFGINLPVKRNDHLKKTQKFFINIITSERNLVQQYSDIDWTFKALSKIFLFKQRKREIIRGYLFPSDKDLYERYYNIPDKINIFIRMVFFLEGIKALIHIGWSFMKIWFLSLQTSVVKSK